MKRIALLAMGTALLLATPALAEEISLRRGQPFLHEQTQLSFPAEISGIRRTTANDYGERQFDVSVNYGDLSDGEVVTIYLYRAGLPDVSLMFPTVSEAILSRAPLHPVNRADMVSTAFTPPGGMTASALRMAFATRGPGVAATGVALVQHGDWMMKVRVSVDDGGPDKVNALIDAALAAFPLEAAMAQQQAAYQVQPCATPMDLAQAEPVDLATDSAAMATVLTTMITASTVIDAEDAEGYAPYATIWCLNAQTLGQYPLFRPDGRSDAYLVPLNDAGTVITAGLINPTLQAVGSEIALRYPVVMHDANGTSVRALFMATPTPGQLPAALNGSSSLGFTDRLGGIELNSALTGGTGESES